ncbi:MAG: hypothetical protein E6I41_08745 [Chloroflexi bacterium]|nr:MAG: hypothetical protein E6I41_08745 [Chloroflexota bacterium]
MAAVPPPPPPDLFGQAARPTDGMAIAALVVGLSAVPGASFLGVPGVVLGIVAIILGLRARGRIKRSGGARGGRGFAVAGMMPAGVVRGWARCGPFI